MGLIFNIFPYYISGNFVTYTPDKISIAPKLPRPQLFPQFRKLLKYLACRHTFQYLHYLRWGISGRYLNKYMHVVFHYSHSIYLELILLSYPLKDLLQMPRNFITQYVLSIFWYPYQVILQVIYSMLRPSITHATFIHEKALFRQAPLPRLTASHFPPASKLAGIQWEIS